MGTSPHFPVPRFLPPRFLHSAWLAQPFFSNSIQEDRSFADEAGSPPFAVSFAEGVGARFPIWNWIDGPFTFPLTWFLQLR
jgi:hypothetical protein